MGKAQRDSLVFVDTNILLDFYRVRGRESPLSILNHFDGNHDRLIMTSQVEMEFKKNRQRVILDSCKQIKHEGSPHVPSFLQDSKPGKGLESATAKVVAQVKRLKERTAKILTSPAANDPIYKVLQRLFRADGDIHMSREKPSRFTIRRLARKRFCLGYPPRKDGDTSMGDAVNWEWIVDCAIRTGSDVVIVSRDADYGVTHDKEAVINDWLRQEFKERVSKKRDITLTNRLTEGFKSANVQVSPAEVQEEDDLLKALGKPPRRCIRCDAELDEEDVGPACNYCAHVAEKTLRE
jgi:hypothetical protein